MNQRQKIKKYMIPQLLMGVCGMLPLGVIYLVLSASRVITITEQVILLVGIIIAMLLSLSLFWLAKIERHLLTLVYGTVKED